MCVIQDVFGWNSEKASVVKHEIWIINFDAVMQGLDFILIGLIAHSLCHPTTITQLSTVGSL